MIKGITGYNEATATSFLGGELPKLEPGGYVIRIMNVKAEETQWGMRLAFQFDIAEGEHKGFFKKLYEATPDNWEGKKWKGSYRIYIPENKGDEARYKKSVGFFKNQVEAFEKSNSGLKINASGDWDEQIFKGKFVGALFNEKEWELNGKTGFATQCKRLVPVDDIRQGNFSIPKPDKLKSSRASASTDTFSSAITAEISSDISADFETFGDDDAGIPF